MSLHRLGLVSALASLRHTRRTHPAGPAKAAVYGVHRLLQRRSQAHGGGDARGFGRRARGYG
ncbi:MAG: hypothetical protein OWS03_00395 [Alicyclobacillaceae bacterium]|nr:hypothetical protein [Alicyclobacillaceae bacterium]